MNVSHIHVFSNSTVFCCKMELIFSTYANIYLDFRKLYSVMTI